MAAFDLHAGVVRVGGWHGGEGKSGDDAEESGFHGVLRKIIESLKLPGSHRCIFRISGRQVQINKDFAQDQAYATSGKSACAKRKKTR
ncbi:hypothetical protein RugamoR64_19140 [Duganella rhizosphaerae]